MQFFNAVTVQSDISYDIHSEVSFCVNRIFEKTRWISREKIIVRYRIIRYLNI